MVGTAACPLSNHPLLHVLTGVFGSTNPLALESWHHDDIVVDYDDDHDDDDVDDDDDDVLAPRTVSKTPATAYRFLHDAFRDGDSDYPLAFSGLFRT